MLPKRSSMYPRGDSSKHYSPECVEWAFSEVGFPIYGVLRSSRGREWKTITLPTINSFGIHRRMFGFRAEVNQQGDGEEHVLSPSYTWVGQGSEFKFV